MVTARPRLLQRGKQTIGHFTIEVIDAPGHSEGSCLLLLEDRCSAGMSCFRKHRLY
ncbi:MAG: MBL fold metallo-hydrolase [Merdibacter sp.]